MQAIVDSVHYCLQRADEEDKTAIANTVLRVRIQFLRRCFFRTSGAYFMSIRQHSFCPDDAVHEPWLPRADRALP